jgi:hypothetical protein
MVEMGKASTSDREYSKRAGACSGHSVTRQLTCAEAFNAGKWQQRKSPAVQELKVGIGFHGANNQGPTDEVELQIMQQQQ